MNKHITIKELPHTERPYEKALHYGVQVLSDAELLAVILRTGTREKTSIELAHEILNLSEVYPGLLGLYHASQPELTGLDGIGTVKSLELLCVAEIAKRMSRLCRVTGNRFHSPKEVAAYYMEHMRALETEHFYVALFDVAGRMLKSEDLFHGTIDSAMVSPREALRLALNYDAYAMVVLHNHPTGDPTPSDSDDETTIRFDEACRQIGILFYDHIVIGDNAYVSYLESGFFEDRENTYQ